MALGAALSFIVITIILIGTFAIILNSFEKSNKGDDDNDEKK